MIYHDWRVHFHERFVCEFKSIHSNCDAMFSSCFRIHNCIFRSRVFVARTCHIIFWLDSSRNRWEFEKNVWLQTFTSLSLLDSDHFSFRENDFKKKRLIFLEKINHNKENYILFRKQTFLYSNSSKLLKEFFETYLFSLIILKSLLHFYWCWINDVSSAFRWRATCFCTCNYDWNRRALRALMSV